MAVLDHEERVYVKVGGEAAAGRKQASPSPLPIQESPSLGGVRRKMPLSPSSSTQSDRVSKAKTP